MNPVDEFLEGEYIEKTAFNKVDFAAQAALAIGAPVALGAAALGYGEVKNMIDRSRGFKGMMDYNPALKKLPAKETKAMYNTLHNIAPSLAKDPVIASSWMNRMADKDNYVDPRTIADLGAAQRSISGGSAFDYPIGPVTTALVGAYGKQRELEQTVRKNDLTAAKDAVSETREQAKFDEWHAMRNVRAAEGAETVKHLRAQGYNVP